MKKVYIVIGLLVAISVGLFIYASDDVSTYSTFDEASASGQRVKIVGTLAKDREMHYDPEEDPNYFKFYLRDANDKIEPVVLTAPKPQDFERSEQIVLTGSMREGTFIATDILMKCPSKYKDEEIFIKSES